MTASMPEGPTLNPTRMSSGYVRASRAVPVIVDQPIVGGTRRFRGRLLGAMYARGEVHHFRVEGDDGVLYLTPPHWLVGTPPLLALAWPKTEDCRLEPAVALEVVL